MDAPRARRARFIPFRRRDIVAMCLAEGVLTPAEADTFRLTAAMVANVVHHEFHVRLEALKDAYAPVAADSDTRTISPTIDGVRPPSRPVDLVKVLNAVLEQGNFEPVTRQELHAALREESLFRVRLEVNYDDFDEVLVFKRGETERRQRVRAWHYLKKQEVKFVNYDRVLIYVRFKDAEHFRRRKRRALAFEPGSVFIKMFQNIPRADVEMLFPNAEVRMKFRDKLIFGVPAVVSGAIIAATRLGAAAVLIGALIAFWVGWRKDEVQLDETALLALAAGLFAIGGYLWRQFSNFKNRKIRFLKLLADNLYFKKLDTNAGVFHRLIDAAEEEESKEAILAYFFLLAAREPLSGRDLDARIETWFREQWACTLDFDLDDAARKLLRYGLAVREDGRYRAVPLEEAQRRLDRLWDDFFHAPPASPAADPAPRAETAKADAPSAPERTAA